MHFAVRQGELHAEEVPFSRIAQTCGTPCYVYSRAAIESRYREYDDAFTGHPHLVCYAVKANSSLAIINLLARLGSGFDIVSAGELERVLAAGGAPDRIVFSGVGKTAGEIRRALEVGIHCFNVESEPELERLSALAAASGRVAPVSIRVNPDVDARTHPYIATGLKENKFGIAHDDALRIYRRAAAMPGIAIAGIDCHIGSQLTEIAPFVAALERILALADRLAADGIEIRHVDIGGGLGIRYQPEDAPPAVAAYAAALRATFGDRPQAILMEPGRSLVAEAGALLTRVEYLKRGEDRGFAIVDCAMNDLMRPALYDAWHPIVPVRESARAPERWEIVGPVCESGDFLGRDRLLSLESGDLLAILCAGAYGMSMSSNYNTRPRAAEVIVDGSDIHVVRARESIADLMRGESLLPQQ
jgi:diaminopimelate decarboxylase